MIQKKIDGKDCSVHVIESFSGNKKYLWEDMNGSAIEPLSLEEVKAIQDSFKNEHHRNKVEEDNIPACVFQKKPQQIIQQKIQEGNEKASKITEPSQIQRSRVFQPCQFCQGLTYEHQKQMKKVSSEQDDLNKQLRHLKQKINQYRQQKDQLQKLNIKLEAENQILKNKLKIQNKSSIKSSFRSSCRLLSNPQALNINYNSSKIVQAGSNENRRSMIIINTQTPSNMQVRLSVILPPSKVAQVEANSNQSRTEILQDIYTQSVQAISDIFVNDDEFEDLLGQ